MAKKKKKQTLKQRIRKTKLYKKLKKAYKHFCYKMYYPTYYKMCCMFHPVEKNRVLFLEMRFTEISNSFQVLYDALQESDTYTTDTAFIRFNFTRGREYRNNVKTALKKLASAEYLILDEASLIISSIPLREETMAINLWHACGAFKKFGRSTGDKKFGASHKELDKYPNYENLDLVTVSSPDIIWAYEEAMHLPQGIVKPLGISRTDIFYNKEFVDSCRERVYEAVPEARGKKIVMYAPTFRGRVAKAKGPNKISWNRFKEELGDEYFFLVKHHPFVKKLPKIPAAAADFAKDVTKTLTIEDLICTADLCISDYSSLVFEYSLFNKPMIFYAYDYDNYCDWRGFYYDYDKLTPGPIVTNQDELLDCIKNIDTAFDENQVRSFREQFMGSCDGHATERIIEAMDAWNK